MATVIKTRRIGNSLGWIIPATVLSAMQVVEGDSVSIILRGRQLIVSPGAETQAKILEAFEQAFRENEAVLDSLADRVATRIQERGAK